MTNTLSVEQEKFKKLRKGYEEVQMVNSSIENAYPEAYRLARKFHNLYEEQAPFFGYITNPNSREFYPNSNNARLMAYVCYTIVQEEVLASNQRVRRQTLQGVQEMIEGEKKETECIHGFISCTDCLRDEVRIDAHNSALSTISANLSALIEQEK